MSKEEKQVQNQNQNVEKPKLVCTCQVTGNNWNTQQIWYNCRTCSTQSDLGVCVICAQTCHAGHDIGDRWGAKGLRNFNSGQFFCDCGAGDLPFTCQNMVSDPFKAVIKAHPLNFWEQNLKPIARAQKLERKSCVISPVSDLMVLEAGGRLLNFTELPEGYDGDKVLKSILLCSETECSFRLEGSDNVHRSESSDEVTSYSTNLAYVQMDSQNIKEFLSLEDGSVKVEDLLGFESLKNGKITTQFRFKGKWRTRFDQESTKKDKVFRNLYDESKVDMMKSEDPIRYIKTSTLKSIVLPYEGDRFVAVLTLPKSDDGYIMSTLSAEGCMKEWSNHLALKELKVKNGYISLPKFKKEWTYEGAQKFFDESYWTKFSEQTGIDQLTHKVVVEFDEAGGNDNSLETVVDNDYDYIEWKGNRPFAMAIVDLETEGPVCWGIVDFE